MESSHTKSESEPLIERLRKKKWRLTVQRRTVAEVLSGSDVHFTVEEVFERARSLVPEISRATVYNVIGELVDMGELQEVQVFTGPTRYDPNAQVEHHHLVCTGCGKIYDVFPEGMDRLELTPEDKQGFSLERIEVIFRGRCERCRTQ
jgi:Fe2+ or Zn2+ uptake regulation protein